MWQAPFDNGITNGGKIIYEPSCRTQLAAAVGVICCADSFQALNVFLVQLIVGSEGEGAWQ